jgi:hypothetical protein
MAGQESQRKDGKTLLNVTHELAGDIALNRRIRANLSARVLLGHVAVMLAYAAAACALFHRAWASPTQRLVGTCCDSAAYVDTFRFTGAALLSGHDPLYSSVMHAPQGFNVMWQPNVMPLIGLVATPFEATVGPMVTYDIVLTAALVLSGWASFVLLRRLVGGVLGPFIGGAFWAFSPVMTAQSLGHPQITFAAAVPLMLIVLTEILVTQRWRWWVAGAALGALAAAQLLLGEELLAFAVIASAVLLVTLVVRFQRQVRSHVRHAAAALAAALGTFAVLAAGPALEQFLGPERISGPIRNTSRAGVNIAAYVTPNHFISEFVTTWVIAADHRWFSVNGLAETTAYLGLPLLVALTAVVVARRREPLVQVTAICTGALAVLALGSTLRMGSTTYDVWLPWRLLHGLPLLSSVAPSRLSILVDLGVAVLIADGIRWVLARRSLPWRLAGLAGAAVALLALLPTFHYPTYVPPVPTFFASKAVDVLPAGSTVLLVPIARGYTGADAASQVWQAEAGLRFAMIGGSVFVPSVNGHNGLPGGTETTLTRPLDMYAERAPTSEIPPLTTADIVTDRRQLRSWGVDTIVLGPMPNRAAALGMLERVIARPPALVGGVYLWTGVGASAGSIWDKREGR